MVTEAEPSSLREGTHAEPSNLEYDGELDTSWRALVQTVVLLLVLIGSAVGAGIYIVDRLQHEREAFAKKAEPVSPAQARPGERDASQPKAEPLSPPPVNPLPAAPTNPLPPFNNSPIVVGGYNPPPIVIGGNNPPPITIGGLQNAPQGNGVAGPSTPIVVGSNVIPVDQRKLALQQRIAALESEIRKDELRLKVYGNAGVAFEQTPNVMQRNPPKGLGPTVLGGIALAAAESFAKEARKSEAEVRLRLRANSDTLTYLRNELANLGR